MLKNLKFTLVTLMAILLCACSSLSPTSTTARSDRLEMIINKGELVVGTTGNMPPLNMVTKDGDIIGFEIDIARAMAEDLGVALRVKTMPFYQLLPALELNAVDIVISGMTITPVRNLRTAFVGPYFISGKAILAKDKVLANVTDTTVIDTPTTRVTALKGSTSQVFVEQMLPKSHLTLVDNYDTAIELLLDDKVHALIADYPICLVALARHPDAGFTPIMNPLSYEPYGIALPAEDPHLINWTENFLGTLEGSGDLEYLRQQWFERDDWLDKVW